MKIEVFGIIGLVVGLCEGLQSKLSIVWLNKSTNDPLAVCNGQFYFKMCYAMV
jgi:hypothetical protein